MSNNTHLFLLICLWHDRSLADPVWAWLGLDPSYRWHRVCPMWLSSSVVQQPSGTYSSPSDTEVQESKSHCPTYFMLLLKSYLIKSHWLQQVMWTNPKSRGKKVCSARHKAKASQRPKPRISDLSNCPFMEVKQGRRG